MEDKCLEEIAELMSQELKKQRVIGPNSFIRATDIVKVPDNYQQITYEKKRKAVYVACIGSRLVITIFYEDGEKRTRVTGVSYR